MGMDADHVTGLKALHWHLLSGHGFPQARLRPSRVYLGDAQA
jgi:hypothetical protein